MNSLTKNLPEFGEEYYRTGNYADYLERGPRYQQLAIELDQLFQMLNLCRKGNSILDYGCGAGFLALGLMNLGYSAVSGWDISEWARSESKARGVDVRLKGADVMIALDVFEHMQDQMVFDALSTAYPDILIVRIPVSAQGGNGEFVLRVSQKDKTHINCKTKRQWESILKGVGFVTILRLNMRTIYDSDGVACLLCIR